MAVLLATVLGSPVTYGAANPVKENDTSQSSVYASEVTWSPENNVNKVSYIDNEINGYDGALELTGTAKPATLTISGQEDKVEFSGNKATASHASGGAIILSGNSISTGTATLGIRNNTVVDICNNQTVATGKSMTANTSNGGAIYMGTNSVVDITGNTNVTISHNSATSSTKEGMTYGGAIAAQGSSLSSLNISNNSGSVRFEDNKAVTGNTNAGGGAIDTGSGVTLKLNNNGELVFKGNKVENMAGGAKGGAISNSGTSGTSLNNAFEISGNTKVAFEGNSVTGKPTYNNSTNSVSGGAIYTNNNNFSITDNGNVSFTNNYVSGVSGTTADSYAYSVKGGAIYTNRGLKIQGNDTVLFGGNYEVTDSGYRMRAIYGQSDTGFYMSANKGGSIELRDGISLNALNTSGDHNLYLNSAYGETEQSGKIIMTGAYTEKMLTDVKGAAGTEQEIADSRRFEVAGDVILNAGTLSLQDKALLSADTLIVKSGAAVEVVGGAQLEAATTFNLTEAVTLAATIDADLVMEANSSFTIIGGAVDMNGHNITIEDGVTINYLVNDLNAIFDIEQVLFENIGTLNANELEIMFTDGTNYSKVEYEVKGNAVVASIPEPTTATLSLLALAALAARRRRK